MKIELRRQIRRAFRERNKMGDVVDFTVKKQMKTKQEVRGGSNSSRASG